MLSEKSEALVAEDLFYVFVNLNCAGGSPSYHIVESRTVAKYISANHKKWISGMRRDGQPRKNNTMRKFADPERRSQDARPPETKLKTRSSYLWQNVIRAAISC